MNIYKPVSKIFLLVCGFVLSACSAYDLGTAGNYYYDIGAENLANPTWEGGINIIVEKKCATCHTAQTPWYKPKNVDEGGFGKQLEGIGTKEFWKKDDPVLAVIKLCLEATCGKEKIPMPPKYATPLSQAEKQALLNYLTPLLPAASAGFSAKFQGCEGCHGKEGKNETSKIGPKLSATGLSLDAFKAVIRAGRGGMPAYAVGAYSDAELEQDYNQLKTLP
ncbi:MAG: Cytochrome oxidase, cbb3-type, subunit [Pseudomonadota bacterium]